MSSYNKTASGVKIVRSHWILFLAVLEAPDLRTVNTTSKVHRVSQDSQTRPCTSESRGEALIALSHSLGSAMKETPIPYSTS